MIRTKEADGSGRAGTAVRVAAELIHVRGVLGGTRERGMTCWRPPRGINREGQRCMAGWTIRNEFLDG